LARPPALRSSARLETATIGRWSRACRFDVESTGRGDGSHGDDGDADAGGIGEDPGGDGADGDAEVPAWNARHPSSTVRVVSSRSNVAAGVAGLAAGLVELVADRDQPTVQGGALLLDVDVRPRESGEPKDREEPVLRRRDLRRTQGPSSG
jgi:hypothetical protein